MTGQTAGQGWPRWVAALTGGLTVLIAGALLSTAGFVAIWLLLSGSPRVDIARAVTTWLAASGVVGFAVGGGMAARLSGTSGGKAAGVGVMAGVVAQGLLVAVVLFGVDEAFDLASLGVALGIVEVAPSVPAYAAQWVDASELTIHPSDLAWKRTIATIGYLLISAALSLGGAGFGGVIAGSGQTGGDAGLDTKQV